MFCVKFPLPDFSSFLDIANKPKAKYYFLLYLHVAESFLKYKSCSVSQVIPRILWSPNRQQHPAISSYPKPHESSQRFPILFLEDAF
jgi:hypothetical protein